MSTDALRKPEVLSPAGSRESLTAAIAAGCDAVYFGITDYNARIRAQNFDLGDLPDVVKDLRRWGVKSCLTFNTLVFLEEERAAKKVLEAIALAGPDALIVQDLGVVRWVREVAPAIDVHASTQMTITSPDGVNLLERLGVRRVVLARELTLPEIAKVRAMTRLELEVFVHGALCVSYSGQCLSSEAWGGRSANRGQCAQACRHPYDLFVDGDEHELGDRAFLLSPRDLEGYRRIPELTALGISAFKIEGRMKGPEYVAAATSLYRAAVDRAWALRETGVSQVPPIRLAELSQRTEAVYSRGASEGFLGGVNHQVLVDGTTRSHRGLAYGRVAAVEPSRTRLGLIIEEHGDPGRPPITLRAGDGLLVALGVREEDEFGGRIIELTTSGPRRVRAVLHRDGGWPAPEKMVGARIYRTSSPELVQELKPFTGRPELMRQITLRAEVRGTAGEPLSLTLRDPEGREATVVSSAPLEPAVGSGLDDQQLREQFSRLGGTRYRLGAMTTQLDGALFCPISDLNRMRRDAVHAMEDLRGRSSLAVTDPRPAAAIAEVAAATIETSPVSWAIDRAERIATAGGEGEVATGDDPADYFDAVVVLCRTREQVSAAIESGARRVALDFLDLVGLKEANAELRSAGVRRTLALPRVQKPGEEKIESFFLGLAPDEILVRNLGGVERLARLRALASESARFPSVVGDTSLNGVNPAAIDALLDLGLARLTPGFDLNAVQLLHLIEKVDAARLELPLHHHLPVFHTEHCVFAAFLSEGADFRTCGRPCDRHQIALRDRTGQHHPVVADVGCRNTVWSAKPQSAVGHLEAFRREGVRNFRLELMHHDRPSTLWLINTYRSVWLGRKSATDALAEMRAEAEYGISTGSPEPPRKLALKPVGGRRELGAGESSKGAAGNLPAGQPAVAKYSSTTGSRGKRAPGARPTPASGSGVTKPNGQKGPRQRPGRSSPSGPTSGKPRGGR
ncbi:MAG: U32 family peptidase [Candidatus Eisenbacteria bacterium]|nr:U32 family peptidase [Candidatus Eisenbacteria bacterium]